MTNTNNTEHSGEEANANMFDQHTNTNANTENESNDDNDENNDDNNKCMLNLSLLVLNDSIIDKMKLDHQDVNMDYKVE